jgi:hypothetical protein
MRNPSISKTSFSGKRRPKGPRRPTQQSAWSKVEDVLAEKRLQRELAEFNDVDEA